MMQHEQAKEIAEKNKVYKKANRSRANYVGVGLVLFIYLFFFLSNQVLPQKMTEAGSVTKLGKEYDFAENRTVSLIRATYSEEQEMMEVLLHFTNKNYDNVNDYFYTLALSGTSTKGKMVEEVFNEDLFTVLRIKDLPKRYREATIYFAPKVVPVDAITDKLTGEIILNTHNVTKQHINLHKGRTDYLKERLNSMITYYEKVLQRQEAILEDLETRAAALTSENEEISENKAYMTEKEIRQREETVIDNEDQLMEVREQIKSENEKIKRTKAEIEQAKAKRDQLKP
ncbi:hypothetical protein OBO34_11230 [Clostridiales Family XIII bacterium ASD5510]|uniref:Uncharacterized protein n=1 Tax=Hominibacterium faecale TaxID=2839743 RepID=A0A9J6QNF5_9FIRM|nr:hypothetical protein [Hominibacterium faecale]MCU7378928.1 hypothetical protein [Hominibacterium faecale]